MAALRALSVLAFAGFGFPSASAATEAGAGGELFTKNCAPCHGADGKAQTAMAKKLHVKDLTVSVLADAAIEQQVLDGRKNERGVVAMPSFRGKLSPEEIQAIVAYVKSLRK